MNKKDDRSLRITVKGTKGASSRGGDSPKAVPARRKRKPLDVIPDEQHVYCWGFAIEALQKASASSYAKPVFRAVLKGLDAVGRSKSPRVRERKFYVWAGDDENLFWCAVRGRLYSRVVSRVSRFLEVAPGFATLEMGTIPYIPLVPQFCYDHGEIGEYDESLWGRGYVDTEKRYGSGVRLRGRAWVPKSDVVSEDRLSRMLASIERRWGRKMVKIMLRQLGGDVDALVKLMWRRGPRRRKNKPAEKQAKFSC